MFPWERRRPWIASLARRNVRLGVGIAIAVLVGWILVRVEDRRRAVYSTRAAISNVMAAVSAFRADHDGGCPASIAALLVASGGGPYLTHRPQDGWGRDLRMTCPGRKHPASADVLSAGPSGSFEDRDQIE